MGALVYDVATSIDGFIAHRDGSVTGLAMDGPHVDAYLARVQRYRTVIMGRSTYEAGYAWGLAPGDKPYPHMKTFVVSSSLDLPPHSDIAIVRADVARSVAAIKADAHDDIYLCGGGRLAGALLSQGLIDRLILKISPIAFGAGTPMFGNAQHSTALGHLETETYPNGVCVSSYEVLSATRA